MLTIKPNVSDIYKPIFNTDWRILIIIGGRAKGATQVVSKYTAIRTIAKRNHRAVIIRNEANKIEESIFIQIKQKLIETDTKSGGQILKAFSLHDLSVKNKATNQNVVFLKGVRASTAEDTDVFKGLEELDLAVVEEAQQVKSGVAIQKLLDTGIRFPDFKLVMLLNTPDTKDHWIIQDYFDLESSDIEGYYKLIPKQKKGVLCIVADYKDNKYLAPEAIEQYEAYEKTSPDWFYHQILGLVPKDGGSRAICKRTHKESWRDGDDKPYYIKHSFIQKMLREEGYFFATFDGGEHTNRKACVLGYHIPRYKRDVLLKEFVNHLDVHDLREVAIQVKEFIEYHQLQGDLRAYGDPKILQDGVHTHIEHTLNLKGNFLEGLRTSDNPMAREIFQNRKKKRLARLTTDIFNLCSDNKPQIIVLKDSENSEMSFGCPKLYKGLFEGLFRYEIDTKGEPTEELEQWKKGDNKHLTDICDAYTYFILANRPFSIQDANNDKMQKTGSVISWGK